MIDTKVRIIFIVSKDFTKFALYRISNCMKKILIYGIAALLMSACGQTYEEKQRMTRAERQRLAREDSLALKMAVMPTLDGMPLYLAKTRGWFDSLNVDVRLKVRNAQMDCDTALVGGSVEGAVTDVKRMERMVAQAARQCRTDQCLLATDSQPYGPCEECVAVGRQNGGHDPLFGHRLSHR